MDYESFYEEKCNELCNMVVWEKFGFQNDEYLIVGFGLIGSWKTFHCINLTFEQDNLGWEEFMAYEILFDDVVQDHFERSDIEDYKIDEQIESLSY